MKRMIDSRGFKILPIKIDFADTTIEGADKFSIRISFKSQKGSIPLFIVAKDKFVFNGGTKFIRLADNLISEYIGSPYNIVNPSDVRTDGYTMNEDADVYFNIRFIFNNETDALSFFGMLATYYKDAETNTLYPISQKVPIYGLFVDFPPLGEA